MAKPRTHQLAVPYWTVSAAKLFGPALAACAAMYGGMEARQVEQERVNAELRIQIKDLETANTELRLRQSNMEVRTESRWETFSQTLVRIETTVKDVQIDVKDLQKNQR